MTTSTIRTGYVRTNDDVELYYRCVGSGPPIICCNGVGVSTFFWRYVVEHFRDRFTLVLWDYRAHGCSGFPKDVEHADVSVGRSALDLRAILEHLNFDTPAILLGHSMGCQVIFEYLRLYPGTVAALVPMFGTYRRPLDTFMGTSASRVLFAGLERIAKWGGRNGMRFVRPLYMSPFTFTIGRRIGMMDRHKARRQDMDLYLEHLNQLDTRFFLRMVNAIADHDLTDFLPTIDVPTLIIGGTRDQFTPITCSHEMAALIPDSDLVIIENGTHAAIIEVPEVINERIERFLRERVSLG